MNCFNHPERDVCATCSECGKGLCQECAAVFQPCLCPQCAAARSSASTTGEAVKIFAKSVVFFAASFFALKYLLMPGGATTSLPSLLVMSLIFSGVPWGWSLISRFFPLAAGGNIAFVIVFYLIKFIAAYFIGLVVMVWNVLKICYLLIKGNREKKNIEKAAEQLSASPRE